MFLTFGVKRVVAADVWIETYRDIGLSKRFILSCLGAMIEASRTDVLSVQVWQICKIHDDSFYLIF